MTVSILVGDVREKLRGLPADSFDCVVTSPPYWGLRDYGVEGQIGLEPTLGEHLAVMVDVFREVRRVLKPTGTLWLNYGDCYATTPNGRSAADTKLAGNDDRTFRDKPFSTIGGALKAKDLCMIPNRLAIALQEDGWWVRSETIWGKSNPMPESIKDRPATAHEKIFMLTKSAHYFYGLGEASVEAKEEYADRYKYAFGGAKAAAGHETGKGRTKPIGDREYTGRRNLRNYEPAPLSVWLMGTAAFSEAHFATFPPELVERCLKAGCPKGGTVLDPFGGAGTTALVADQMQLDCTIIELNPEYVHIAARRIESDRGAISNALDPLQIDMLAGAA
jgi:DNA modification methylase